jgi:hypothetical protein
MKLMVLALGAGVAVAQPPAEPAPPVKEPTLDDLLGLRPAPEKPAPPAVDPAQVELERALTTQEVDEAFEQAVGLMRQVAERLGTAKDTGLDTQRLQGDILAKLDKLLDDAQRNSQQQQSRSRSRGSQQQQQQGQPGQQSSQQQAGAAQPSNQGGNPDVPRQDGELRAAATGGAASWGNLPPHLRESLTQGRSDRFSSLYQQLTEEYYKRLAEERRAGAPR